MKTGQNNLNKRISHFIKNFHPTTSKNNPNELISFMDLTSLTGSETADEITLLCHKAAGEKETTKKCAAICIYSKWIEMASNIRNIIHQSKEELKAVEPTFSMATVSLGFPEGRESTDLKKGHIREALHMGANEIDMVINHDLFLEGDTQNTQKDIQLLKEVTPLLKVIIETGRLKTPELIYSASMVSMKSGADFIKSSTGKNYPGVNKESLCAMLFAIADYYEQTGKKVGIKASGGIRSITDAYDYLNLTTQILGKEYKDPKLFRIGASSLWDKCVQS